jgi:hypothetical protein
MGMNSGELPGSENVTITFFRQNAFATRGFVWVHLIGNKALGGVAGNGLPIAFLSADSNKEG